MRTSVDLSDELFRRAKAAAALRGQKFKDLIEQGLEHVLECPNVLHKQPRRKKTLYELMESARGIIGSGIPDLATNPKHMKLFGRD